MVQPSKIKYDSNNSLVVSSNPIIPYITGDGIGEDITPVMLNVVDAAVKKAYANEREISWLEIYAGEKAQQKFNDCLPQETLDKIIDCKVAIKGPLATPVGTGIRSLNVALRQKLDLYTCLRPIRYFTGTPSPLKNPEFTDMVIFRENSEDIYAGIEWQAGTEEANQVISFLQKTMQVDKIRFSNQCGIGIKPISKSGTQRLVKAAIEYAIEHNRKSVTLVHKGNIMKYTEGSFMQWGYEIAKQEFGATLIEQGPWLNIVNPKTNNNIVIKDVIADAFLQQILLRPKEYDVIATSNLNGDYISDALAAQVGGIGIAPGANLSDKVAVFEATHGTAPKYAGLDKVNPGSLILSAEMMLRHIGWNEAAELIIKGVERSIEAKTVTYDFARMLPNAIELSCSDFGKQIIEMM